jgi:hypothetical protein
MKTSGLLLLSLAVLAPSALAEGPPSGPLTLPQTIEAVIAH